VGDRLKSRSPWRGRSSPVITINGRRLDDAQARFVRAAVSIVLEQMRGARFVGFELNDAAKVQAAIKRPHAV
jgi:hypothetical protein